MVEFYEVMHTIVPPLGRAVWRPTVEGMHHVPASGGVILASNHLSFVDSVVIPIVAPREVVFMAKESYFTGTGIKGAAQRAWFEALGMVPVNREDTKSATDSVAIAAEVLAKGKALGLYPEGTRSRDGRLYRGRTGVAQLALNVGVPVVPVGLQGTEKVLPVGSKRPRLVKMTVRFGEPLHFAGKYDDVPPGRARREVTDLIMAEIQKLSGQVEAGHYNELPPTID